jgi:DNA-binding IclR family transcriptional regulator
MIAGVSIVAPSLTFPVKDIKKALPHLFETAKKISAEMGADFESQIFQ